MEQAKPQVVLISIEVSTFGGYRRSTEDDIEDAGGKAPNTDVLTKGGKHVFPPDRLAPIATNKRDVIRQISQYGVKAFKNSSVFAISTDDLQKAEETLENGIAEHNRLVADLADNYDDWLEDYILAQKLEVQTIIRRSALTKDEAISKFGFRYSPFVPTPVGKNASVEGLQHTLVVQLYNEIAATALDLYDKSIYPKDSNGVRTERMIGQKTKRPIIAAKEKLTALSFLHPGIEGGIELIESVLQETQFSGYLVDEIGMPAKTQFVKLVELMASAPNFRTAAEQVAAGEKDWREVLGIQQQPQGDIFTPPQTAQQMIEQVVAAPSLEEAAPKEVALEEVAETQAQSSVAPPPALKKAAMAELAFF